MKEKLIVYLCCIECSGDFRVQSSRIESGEIKEGLLICRGCGKTYPITNFIPRFVEADNYANPFGLEWSQHQKTQIDKFNGTTISHDYFYKVTNWNKKDLQSNVVLEVGCGAGRFTEVLIEADAEIISFDLSNSVDVCLENLGLANNLHIIQADIYKLPLKKKCFDKIVCRGVLQFTPRVEDSFMALIPLLKEGGEIAMDMFRKRWYMFPKYVIRFFTTRIKQEKLYKYVSKAVPALLPVSTFIRTKIPVVGFPLSRAIPIKNFKNILPLNDEQLLEWGILDTFNAYSPVFEKPQKVKTVKNWFIKAGLVDITINNTIIARGKKSVS